jgi:CubicO group peptidase (beta-lactamase class C family)
VNKLVAVPHSLLIIGFLLIYSGLSAQDRNQYDKYLQKKYDKGEFNGNILIVKNDSIILHKSYGIKSIAPSDTLNQNSVFRLGSVSKQFTTMGIMVLKDQGKLTFDQELSEFIPELSFYKGVTIRHMMNHVSGIPDYIHLMQKFYHPELENDDPQKMLSGNQDVINYFNEVKPSILFKPGEKYQYCNTGYILLASIIEKVSKLSFSEFMKINVFDPAGMKNTVVYKYTVGYDSLMPNRVFGIKNQDGKFQLYDTDYLCNVVGDGGIYSTTGDLRLWDKILYTDEIVSQSTLKEAFTCTKLNNGEISNYGFGWKILQWTEQKKVVEHKGLFVAFRTFIYRDISSKNLIVFLTNDTSLKCKKICNKLQSMVEKNNVK